MEGYREVMWKDILQLFGVIISYERILEPGLIILLGDMAISLNSFKCLICKSVTSLFKGDHTQCIKV